MSLFILFPASLCSRDSVSYETRPLFYVAVSSPNCFESRAERQRLWHHLRALLYRMRSTLMDPFVFFSGVSENAHGKPGKRIGGVLSIYLLLNVCYYITQSRFRVACRNGTPRRYSGAPNFVGIRPAKLVVFCFKPPLDCIRYWHECP